MTFLPSNVQTGACSSSSTRSLKCVPLALSSLSWSVRYERGLVRVAVVMASSILFGAYERAIYDGLARYSKHDRIAGGDTGLAQLLHIVEKLFFGIGQDVAGVEHGFDFLQQFRRYFAGEPIADTAALIDEIPVLAAVAPYTDGGLEVRDAKELRVKESDRIAAVAADLRKMGAEVEERPDGMRIPGGQHLHGAELDSFGDHRIAMAFAVAALRSEGETTILGADAAGVSYPAFFEELRTVSSC